jgi:hypothetical protein
MSTSDAVLCESFQSTNQNAKDPGHNSSKNNVTVEIDDSLEELANDINSINDIDDEMMHSLLLESVLLHNSCELVSSTELVELNSFVEVSNENKRDMYMRQHPIEDYAANIPRSQPITIVHSAIKKRNKSNYTGSLKILGRKMSGGVKWLISKSI